MKKLPLVGIVLIVCLTLFMKIGLSNGDHPIEVYLNKTCVNSSYIRIWAEWEDCDIGVCNYDNYTQEHECQYGCDSSIHECEQAPYIVSLLIIAGVMALILIMVWVFKK